MTTLYELLGAHPQDDKEDLKRKFHVAVKASHPDTHPEDPGASVRFRQIVRAHAVLSDDALRAAYDDMLSHQDGARRGILSATMAKIVPDAIAISLLVAVMLGGYALFVHLSKASVAAGGANVVHGPATIAAVAPQVSPVVPPVAPEVSPVVRSEPRDAPARAELDHEAGALGAVAIASVPSGEAVADVAPSALPAPSGLDAPRDAAFYREEGRRAYRAGDFDLAVADFDLAIELDPGFEAAYIDRSIVLYRLGEVERAFADLEKAKRIADADRAGTQQRKALSSNR
jgi:hypothetical protein